MRLIPPQAIETKNSRTVMNDFMNNAHCLRLLATVLMWIWNIEQDWIETVWRSCDLQGIPDTTLMFARSKYHS
jgi:hypothetical protein